MSNESSIYNVKSEYSLNIMIENNGECDEELSAAKENVFHLEFGILFCPKFVCSINEANGKEEQMYTVDGDVDGAPGGICFEVFDRLFQKLKEKNLVQDYSLDEMECSIEAFHPDYKILERFDAVIDATHFGIGFYLGQVPKTREINEDELNYMVEVQNILIDLKSEFKILEKEELNLQYNLNCQFNN